MIPSKMTSLRAEGWALVLGASSGFGEAIATALALAGADIVGVHLDRRGTHDHVEQVRSTIRSFGRKELFFNINAANEAKRLEVLSELASRWSAEQTQINVLIHSLAFGSLLPLVGADEAAQTSERQLAMTHEVMAHSLVSWVQGLMSRNLLRPGARILAMTSAGATSVWPGYGAVSAAKCALEAYVRQLAIELAPTGTTVNAICAGVTDTPALRRIPTHEALVHVALRKNPHGRLTLPDDVAHAILALIQPETYWMTGNVIHVDGGEGIVG